MPDQDPIRIRDQQPPTLRELAIVLFRKRRVFVCVSALVMGIAVFYAITGTTYRANMKILVRRGRADAPMSAGVNAPLDLTRIAVTEEELNSEVELLRDDEVLRRVVQQTGAGGRDWLHFLRLREGRAERIERAARRLAKRITVDPLKKTNLIAISYSASDPQAAAKVLLALASLYMEKHTAVHRPEGELNFFEQQTADAKGQLEESSQLLRRFTKGHGVIAAAQQRDLALQKLSELEAADRQTRIELAETQQRASELEVLLAGLPERTTTQVRTADNAELLKSLKTSLLDLQLKRTQLLTKFEPDHRLVQEVDQQIAENENAIAAERSSPVHDETTNKNAHYEWAKAELQRTQVELKALAVRQGATIAQEAACRVVAGKLGEDAITQDDLLSTKKVAQENYLLYVKKREEARMDDALDQRGIVNVVIAEQPIAPALPVWSPWTTLAIGLLGAGVTGAGAAFASDYLDPAFRDPADVVAYLNAPVLASLPRAERGKLLALGQKS